MSLTGNLAKIALGIVVAKGVKKMMSGNSNPQTSGGGGLGSILGQLGQGSGQSGGLGAILGQLQGGSSSGQASSGGLGGMLGGLLGQGQQSQSSSGGLGGMLGGLLGQGQQSQSSSGGLGGMLGGLLGQGQQSKSSSSGLGGLLGSLGGGSGGFGGMLNQAMSNFGEPEAKPSDEDEQVSGILLTAMLQAAKADGMVDENEKAAIMEHLKDASASEMAFIQKQFEAPVDPEGLAKSIPRGMEQQAYAMSLLAIDLDSKKEANYLDTFAKALRLDAKTVNSIHSQMNEPALYS